MSQLPGGWLDLSQSNPLPIANVIAYAMLGTTAGTIKNSTNFNVPTSAPWVTSPLSFTSPSVVAVNAVTNPDEAMLAQAMNAQTQMANLTAAFPLTNLVYLYGNNPGELKYEMDIPVNLGVNNYDSVQISILENAATSGIDQSGKIQVIDFGSGPFTGALTLKLMLSGYYGEVHIGIRVNKITTNNSSIFDLRAIILPVNSSNFINQNLTLLDNIEIANALQENMSQINGPKIQSNLSAAQQSSDCKILHGIKFCVPYTNPGPRGCGRPYGMCDRLFDPGPCKIVFS